MMERAFDEVAGALRDGELVGIFPEGRITDTGEMYPFRPGIERIVGGDAGAGRADGAARPVGQLLQPQGRRGDDQAVPPRAVREDRAGRGAGPGAGAASPEALQAAVRRCAAIGAEFCLFGSEIPCPF